MSCALASQLPACAHSACSSAVVLPVAVQPDRRRTTLPSLLRMATTGAPAVPTCSEVTSRPTSEVSCGGCIRVHDVPGDVAPATVSALVWMSQLEPGVSWPAAVPLEDPQAASSVPASAAAPTVRSTVAMVSPVRRTSLIPL